MRVKIRVTVCDVCQGTERPAKTYKMVVDGQGSAVDLCEEHASPLLATFNINTPAVVTKPRRRRATTKVTTLEEIEAAKKTRT